MRFIELVFVALLLATMYPAKAMYYEEGYRKILGLEKERGHRPRSIYGKHVVCGADLIEAIYEICNCMIFPKAREPAMQAFIDCCEEGCSRRRIHHLFCC